MKKILFAALTLSLIATATSCHKKGTVVVDTNATPELKTQNDSLSWALGLSIAQNIAATGIDVNREMLILSIYTTLDQKQQPMTQTQTYDLLQEIERLAYLNRSKTQKTQLEDTRAREAEYFANLVKTNPNVKKSDKGFYYEVIKEGNGRQGAPGLVVVFDYKGSFTNGQIFDQTYGNRDAITHVVSETMMPGLIDAFSMMKAGSTYRFYFPAEKAFGANGTEGIPPFSTVIYDIELHEVRDL